MHKISQGVEDNLKAEVEALLLEEQHLDLNNNFAPSSAPHLTSFILLIGLGCSSIGQGFTLPRASLQPLAAILFLAPIHFGLLSLGGLVWSTTQFGGRIIGDGNSKRKIGIVTLLSVISYGLNLWQATWLNSSVWSAIEIFILPLLILFGSLATHGDQSYDGAPYLTAISVAFMTGFALLNVTSSGIEILIPLVRLPIEAIRWSMMAKELSGDRPASFLTTTSTFSFVVTVATVVFNAFLAKPVESIADPVDISLLVRFSISNILSQFFLFGCFIIFTSTLTPSTTILIRNFVMILIGRVSRSGRQSNGGWLQMICVCVGGAMAMLWADEEVNQLPKSITLSGERKRKMSNIEDMLPARNSYPRLGGNASSKPSRPYRLACLPFIPLLLYLLLPASATTTSSFFTACAYLPPSVANSVCYSFGRSQNSSTVDLVFSYYEEDLEKFKSHVDNIRGGDFVEARRSRVLVYNKGSKSRQEIRSALNLQKDDEVVALPNLGREGASYLHHILAHYNSTIEAITASSTNRPSLKTTVLADYTYFLQPHLAWSWIAQNRLNAVATDTGFAHFGPYVKNNCGVDDISQADFTLVKDIFEIFTGEICDPRGQLSAWSGQFVVSKLRILSNEYHRYEALNNLLEAPEDHWIHQRVWTPNDSGGPSNPGFGHYVERSWPVIFGCKDPTMADRCGEEEFAKELCQCLDELG